jgi:membrane protein DedA with SNARE-associated domain
MLQHVLQAALHFKYFGIYFLLMFGVIGLPLPDETTLIFLGYLVSRNKLLLLPTLAATFLGSATGVSLSFLLGRTFGIFLLKRFGRKFNITEAQIGRMHAWFERVGKWGLPIGYFLPGIRHLNAYIAGSAKLEYPVFALFAYPGALIWTMLFVLAGNYLGEGWEQISDQWRGKVLIGAGVLVAVGLSVWLWKKMSARKAV